MWVFVPKCLILQFNSAVFSKAWKKALWGNFFTGAPRPRTLSDLHYSDRRFSAQLSKELGIDLKAAAKWRKRATVKELKTGPKGRAFNRTIKAATAKNTITTAMISCARTSLTSWMQTASRAGSRYSVVSGPKTTSVRFGF